MSDDTKVTLKTGDGETVLATTMGDMKAAADRLNRKPPMKDDPDFRKHNEQAFDVTAGELRQFIEQVEQLESEKKEISDQIKETFAEAKARGYDSKALKAVIGLRKRDKDELAEHEAIVDLYKQSLGMV